MKDLPAVGTLWKYTGMNPAIRHGGEYGSETFLNPTFQIDRYNEAGSVVYLKILGVVPAREILYSLSSFLKHFIPHNSAASEQLMPYQVLVGQALFQGVTKEEIHDLLMALEI